MSAPAQTHTQLIDAIIQKKSKKPIIGDTTLPYLQELLSLNDLAVRKAKAHERLSRYATYIPKYRHFETAKHILNYPSCSATNHISCVFGQFWESWNTYKERRPQIWANTVKCGIEILSAEPNATGSTYSNKCRITVKELKEACKANGIKPTGDKMALLSALMKI